MYSGFSYALTLASLLVIVVLFMPLLVFTWQFLENPACLEIAPGGNVTPIGDDYYKFNITVSYCSSVELRNVRIRVGNITLEFSSLTRGNTTREVIARQSDIEQAPREVEVEASIAGLYRVGFKFKNESKGG
ncbi:MAG: hypothetical protein ACO2OR_05170 [Desulfurococcaceae archaeon]